MKTNWFRTHEQGLRHHAGRVIDLLILAVFLLQASGVFEIDLLRRLEAIAYDTRVQLTMPKTVFPGIVIVDIDEKSLAEEGRWPWGRDHMAVLMDQLFDHYKIAAAGFDVVFAEPDENSGLQVLQQLGQTELKAVPQYQVALEKLRPSLEHDALFAASLQGRPVVLGYHFSSASDGIHTSGTLPPPLFSNEVFKQTNTQFLTASGYSANLAVLQEAAAGGFFSFVPGFDGVSRSVPMLIQYQGNYYESLTLALARVVLGVDQVTPVTPQNGDYSALEELIVGAMRIPVDEHANALVPYRGGKGSFRYISASDVLHGRLPLDDLADKIVLIGTSAPGLMDLRATPVSNVFPGVEVHANLLAGILEQNIKQKPIYAKAIGIVTLLATGILMIWLLPRLSPVKAIMATIVALLSIFIGNLAAWQQADMVLPVASPMLLILILFVVDIVSGFFFESRAKKQMSGLFGQYIPPELVVEMSRDPAMFDMKSENKEMTVLFSDIRDFTKISETLDANELSQLINAYLTPMTGIIHHHQGTIDKYIGDAIMAFWSAPITDALHAQHALMAALEMQSRLQELSVAFAKKGWPELHIGIGINTGVMSVGNMGSEFRRAYTVMGDSVNLASRLESLTKQYGIGMLVGESTRNKVTGIVFQEIDQVTVKGKREPVTIYCPLGLEGAVTQRILDNVARFDSVLALYRAREWAAAETILLSLPENEGKHRLDSLYLERIANYRLNP
ncbi:MAG: adenylate/guanylate cyclase domain-containing protein, partial [Gallionella sp.]|nr:adenylate/guanylate cyclase domain-containing protein [Gallionella sp.]